MSYRGVYYLCILQSRPAITTRGCISNRINRQTPAVGGPIQLSWGLARDNKPASCLLSSHTHARTHIHSHLPPCSKNPSRPGYIQVCSACKCRLRVKSSPCLDGSVFEREREKERETGSCVCFCRHMRISLCTGRLARVHGDRTEPEDPSIFSILPAAAVQYPSAYKKGIE